MSEKKQATRKAIHRIYPKIKPGKNGEYFVTSRLVHSKSADKLLPKYTIRRLSKDGKITTCGSVDKFNTLTEAKARVLTLSEVDAMNRFKTISELKASNESLGNQFYDCGYDVEVMKKVYGGNVFIVKNCGRYDVSVVKKTFDVKLMNSFNSFKEAETFANKFVSDGRNEQ